MKLSQILKWPQTKNFLMRLFYYSYIPIILLFGFRSMNLEALFPQMASRK